jgi:hypothetical protein
MTGKITTVLAATLVLASTGFAIAFYQADRDGDALMVKMSSGID